MLATTHASKPDRADDFTFVRRAMRPLDVRGRSMIDSRFPAARNAPAVGRAQTAMQSVSSFTPRRLSRDAASLFTTKPGGPASA